ncbi:MAG: flagellar M-ring protein FliF [Clostridiaceae bacterium]|jgi:flagellar M-ring protein FliF|nr:flagellar M-ring protein FliF [Clostridiaceae bacterium]
MPEGIKKLFDKIKSFWGNLEKSQKIRIFIMAGVLLFAVAVTMVLTLKIEYVPLFDTTQEVNLQPVVSYLTENDIKFKKGDNQIFVDSKRKKDIEFDLTTQGVVSPEITFADTWSKLSLTATESDKENLWKNYVTNDLVYKLKKFENVENATVQYSKPEKTYWVKSDSEEQQGSAYVMLKTKEALTPNQVDAAAKVVAASLGIPAERITIVDHKLNPLSRDYNQTDILKASSQDEMRRQRQLELENKVYDLFKIGVAQNEYFDTISVSANAVLDFDTLTSTSTKYDPPVAEEDAVLNEEILEETLINGNTGDIPGTDTNPQGTITYQMGEDGNSQYNKSHTVREYLYNQTNEQKEKAVGKLINEQSTMSISLWYGKHITSPDGLTPEYLEQVRQSAYAATGVPVENITISVQKLAADTPVEVTIMETVGELFDQFGFYALMLILLIVMVITAMPKKKAVPEDVQAVAMEAAVAAEGPDTQPAEILPDINIQEQSELKKQIEKFVQDNPDSVAQLLRNWLAEDWE